MVPRLLALSLAICSLTPFAAPQDDSIEPAVGVALDRISADSLRGHLSFIASDMLGGRDTPSPGLDIAAEYIAAQFRRAGLEPVGDQGYFQIADYQTIGPEPKRCELSVTLNGESHTIAADRCSEQPTTDLDWRALPLVRLAVNDVENIEGELAEKIEGAVVVIDGPASDRGSRFRFFRVRRGLLARLTELKPAGVVFASPGDPGSQDSRSRLRAPEADGPAILTVHDPALLAWHEKTSSGLTDATISLAFEPDATPVPLKNVVGLLRGSDPELSKTYVLVTAHYDHIGTRADGDGDRIANGANDDGSGTVSVMELARVLGAMQPRPKRSLVFMTLFGEEKGLLGSRYYGAHPIFPIEDTVANVNLEHMGRTDDNEGPQIKRATMTGFDYSDVGTIFQKAGEATGIEVYKHEANSDSFFSRSDNQALADLGVPSHTVCVSFIFPDYHGVGDHWDKVDYDNLASVLHAVGLTLVRIANDPRAPKWNRDNPRARRYVEAWDAMHK
ncbi:MAG: M28 family peptidase [Planctomycetota bacterium]